MKDEALQLLYMHLEQVEQGAGEGPLLMSFLEDGHKIHEAKWDVQTALTALYIEQNASLIENVVDGCTREESAARRWTDQYANVIGKMVDDALQVSQLPSIPMREPRIRFVKELMGLAPLCHKRVRMDEEGVIRLPNDPGLKEQLSRFQQMLERERLG
jgi:hypothetical protein